MRWPRCADVRGEARGGRRAHLIGQEMELQRERRTPSACFADAARRRDVLAVERLLHVLEQRLVLGRLVRLAEDARRVREQIGRVREERRRDQVLVVVAPG